MRNKKLIALTILFFGLGILILKTQTCSNYKTKQTNRLFQIINIYPHDPNAFTQGLEYNDGYLYESTGLHGKSSIRKVDIKTGEVLKIKKLSNNLFGEGITILNDKIYQLTWKARHGFIYDKNTFSYIDTFSYKTQGWGITNNSYELIYSDGSSKLYFMNPNSFEIVKVLNISDKDGNAVHNINELEYINGKIYANIWLSDNIVVINPKTGIIEKWINLSMLRGKLKSKEKVNVLNGIAYNSVDKSFYVTGKYWPYLFQLRIN